MQRIDCFIKKNIIILLDESTDVSHKSILLLYLPFHLQKQNICEFFMKLFELKKADAQYIYDKVKSFLIKEKNNFLR